MHDGFNTNVYVLMVEYNYLRIYLHTYMCHLFWYFHSDDIIYLMVLDETKLYG